MLLFFLFFCRIGSHKTFFSHGMFGLTWLSLFCVFGGVLASSFYFVFLGRELPALSQPLDFRQLGWQILKTIATSTLVCGFQRFVVGYDGTSTSRLPKLKCWLL